MNTLFPVESKLPPGFVYFEDFLTVDEETRLYNEIQKIEMKNMQFQGYEAKRKVASFGYDWSFEKRMLSKGKDIPAEFDTLINKVANHLPFEKNIAELLVTEYPVGSVIDWHRDAPPFDIIAGISILSDCVFRLRPYDKLKRSRSSIISLPVKRRSLYAMSGIARNNWEHSIAAVKQLRYSITLRTLRQ
jgi:alkylated DNA repair dioxygenase AlkB